MGTTQSSSNPTLDGDWKQLNLDVMGHILIQLRCQDVCKLSQVSKNTHTLIMQQSVWKSLAEKHFFNELATHHDHPIIESSRRSGNWINVYKLLHETLPIFKKVEDLATKQRRHVHRFISVCLVITCV
jgi:hypothetical protein